MAWGTAQGDAPTLARHAAQRIQSERCQVATGPGLQREVQPPAQSAAVEAAQSLADLRRLGPGAGAQLQQASAWSSNPLQSTRAHLAGTRPPASSSQSPGRRSLRGDNARTLSLSRRTMRHTRPLVPRGSVKETAQSAGPCENLGSVLEVEAHEEPFQVAGGVPRAKHQARRVEGRARVLPQEPGDIVEAFLAGLAAD